MNKVQENNFTDKTHHHQKPSDFNFYLGADLLSCVVSELQKPSSPELEPRTDFHGCDLCSCNLLAETNNFGLGAVLLSCLDSELQEPLSPRLELSTVFWSFDLSKTSSWFQVITVSGLVQIGVSVLKL
jgi:hypothetical protein